MMDENRSEIMHDALNLLDDDMIEEVERLRGGSIEENSQKIQAQEPKRRITAWRKWSALAASVCILAAGSWLWTTYIAPVNDLEQQEEMENVSDSIESVEAIEGEDEKNNDTDAANLDSFVQVESASAVVIPSMEVDLRKEIGGAEVDMLAFFIYEGRCYVQNEYFEEGRDFVGEYVGTATGLIDEWTTKDGYVDYAGSVAGDFYTVKGISPNFMLCMKYDDGGVETFVNNNGLTLEKGADILEERLHVKEQYQSVSVLTHNEWDYSFKEPVAIEDEHREVLDKFMDSFNENSFMYCEDMPSQTEPEYHLYFELDNGLRIHLWLLEDGYVVFHGLNNVCVQIDSEVYQQLLTILE